MRSNFLRRKSKVLVSIVLVCVLALLTTGCSSKAPDTKQGTSNDKITLKLAHHMAIDGLQNVYTQKFADLVAKKTSDQVQIQILPASQLGSQREIIEGVKIGTIDMALADHAYLSNLVPEYGLLDLPFIFRDYDHLGKVLDGPIVKKMGEKLIQTQGIRPFDWMFVGFRYVITTKKPIKSISDFNGLKLRAPEAPVYINTIKALGARPTPIPWGEVYTSLQTNVVEGMESAPESIYSMKFYEVAKYLTKTDHIQVSIVPVINEKIWQGLKPEYQKAIQESITELIPAERKEAIKVADEDTKLMQDKGIQVFEIDKQPLVDAVKPVWKEYGEKINAMDVIDQIVNTK
ncbi:MAG TPA: TRAP transporter substrate-binding protein [Desulfosporosinus sp.]|nr:TRAP transporter substrate-binding protein [Desulfosporosinus sp.]